MVLYNYKKHASRVAKELAKLTTVKELSMLLQDLCTPQELENFNERLSIIEHLQKGETQREVSKKLKVSISTVTRGAKQLKYGSGGFNLINKHK